VPPANVALKRVYAWPPLLLIDFASNPVFHLLPGIAQELKRQFFENLLLQRR
jgi:hypothetical protein